MFEHGVCSGVVFIKGGLSFSVYDCCTSKAYIKKHSSKLILTAKRRSCQKILIIQLKYFFVSGWLKVS